MNSLRFNAMKNRSFYFILILIGLTVQCYGQFGLRTSYNINKAASWNNFFESVEPSNQGIFDNSFSITLDYWMRLPNARIEFYPNISYHQSQSTLSQNTIGLRQIGFGIISHIYLFDLIGDCDCPTFSKQGNLLKKGFFLLGGLGTDLSSKAINNLYGDSNIDFKTHLGIGIDVGINDFLTLTPFVQYTYYPDISWHDLAAVYGQDINNVNSSLSQFQLGIRIGFRPDYK